MAVCLSQQGQDHLGEGREWGGGRRGEGSVRGALDEAVVVTVTVCLSLCGQGHLVKGRRQKGEGEGEVGKE